jgi:O-antigen/teichoic acid export membrane protein
METNRKNILISGSFNLISNVLLRAISIITVPIFTRMMNPSDFGIVSNYSAIYTILSVVLSLSLSSSVGVAFIKSESKINEFIASIIVLYSFFVLFFFGIVSFNANQILLEFNFTISLLLFISFSLLFIPSLDVSLELLKFNYNYKKLLWISIFISVFGLFIAFFFINILPNEKYLGRILGIYLPSCILGMISYFKFLKNFKKSEFLKHCKYALKISLPMIPHSLGMIIFTQIDRILISKFDGLNNAGIYSFGLTYALLVQVMANAIMSAFTPWLYDAYTKNKFVQIRLYSQKIFLYFGLLVFGIITFSDEIIMLLGSVKFIAAKAVVFSLAIATFFQFIYGFFASMEIFKEKTKYLALGTILVSVFSFVLNYFLIPKFGFIASGYISLLSYLFLSIIHGLIAYKILKKDIFGIVGIILLSIVLISFSFISFYLIKDLLMRFIFFVIAALILLWNDRFLILFFFKSITV